MKTILEVSESGNMGVYVSSTECKTEVMIKNGQTCLNYGGNPPDNLKVIGSESKACH